MARQDLSSTGLDLRARVSTVEHMEVRGLQAVRLSTALASAVITPGKGADVVSFRCRRTGLETLATEADAEAICEQFRRLGARSYGQCFTGGWPLLLPSRAEWDNGRTMLADECGEAATVRWQVVIGGSIERPEVICSTVLPRSELEISRRFAFGSSGAVLRVQTLARNFGRVACRLNWTEHTTFGGDLLEGDFTVELPECGVMLPRGSPTGQIFPSTHVPVRGAPLDLRLARAVPGEDLFVTLVSPAVAKVVIRNRPKAIGICLRWDRATLGHAWYWQSLRDGRFSLAVEPSNSCDTELTDDVTHGLPICLLPGESTTTSASLELLGSGRRLPVVMRSVPAP